MNDRFLVSRTKNSPDTGKWAYISDSARHNQGLPKACGIYAFIQLNLSTGVRQVVYIGKSENLSVRLKLGHEAEKVFKSSPKNEGSVLILKIKLTADLHTKEIEYIKRLTPRYNIRHNPIIQRKIVYENGETIHRY